MTPLRARRVGDDPFARQTLIRGWRQEAVENARVLIAGVGALGSACAADLVLTGVRHFALADFDRVSTSNLSRALVFRRGDEGRPKVDAARERLAALAPGEPPNMVALDTDVVWELGWGVYRRADIVLGCVDTVDARAAVGAAAWAAGVPAVFGGIFGFDGSVVVQGVRNGACIACGFGPADWRERTSRFSCDDVKRVAATQALVPATQVIASLIGALMTNEALHLLHGDTNRGSRRLYVSGRQPELLSIGVGRRAACRHHPTVESVREEPGLSSRMTAGALLEHVRAVFGSDATVAIGRDFLLTAACKGCRSLLPLARPRHRTSERDLICDACWTAGRETSADPQLQILTDLSRDTPSNVLEMTLEALGTPALHVLPVATGDGIQWIELTGDAERLLQGWPAGRIQTR